jgi:hypothetical protein
MTVSFKKKISGDCRLGKKMNFFTAAILLVSAVLMLNSCIEDATELGINLLPETDFFNVYEIDTLSFNSYNISYGRINTSQPENSFLGTGYDPYFGNTSAEFVTQLQLNSSEYQDFTCVIDSVALYMNVYNVIGSVDGPHYLSFYEIADDINRDSTYYSDSEIAHTGLAVTRILLPKLNKTITTSVRLTIPNSFGEYLVREPEHLTNYPDSGKLSFRDFFKGLHFKLDSPIEEAFLTFSIDPPETALDYSNYFVLYLTDTVDNTQEQLKFVLDATNENARFNIYNYDMSVAENTIEHLDDGFPDTMAYINKWGSVATKIRLTGLEALKNNPEFDNISVTKARLIFPSYFDEQTYTVENSPQRLLLKFYNADGTSEYVQDYIDVSTSFYYGALSSNEDTYVFNIPTFVQVYLDDDTGSILPELEITIPPNSENSAILKANNSIVPPVLELSYVK